MRHWHKRWFVLESPGKLLYYADKEKYDLKGIIPLDMIEKMLFRATRLTLLMEGASENAPPRKFSLKGDSDEIVQSWGAAINKAFEELDRMDEEEDHDKKTEDISEGDGKYWKVETRKKLNLSVALEDKPKKKKAGLKIDPRAKEIEAQIAEKEVAERKLSVAAEASGRVAEVPEQAVATVEPPHPTATTGGYIALNDDNVVVLPPVSSESLPSSPSREEEDARRQAEQADRDRVERQKVRELQDEADLVAAIAASQMDPPTQPMEG